jgi:Ca2+-binding EF-hand superfamily protein
MHVRGFVQHARITSVAWLQTDKDSREDITKVFSLFDVEGKGKISIRDLKRVAKELGETMTGT